MMNAVFVFRHPGRILLRFRMIGSYTLYRRIARWPVSASLSRPCRAALLSILFLAVGRPSTSAAQEADYLFPDSVVTVPTSIPLPTRGSLGGVAVDRLGIVYLSNFRDEVWKIEPDGTTTLLASGLYGASGNAIDRQGRLLQASFYGDVIYRIERTGAVETFVDEGLQGPVGITSGGDGTFYVVNCRGNYVAHISAQGEASVFSEGPFFACPNGIVRAPDGMLYVANFSNSHIVAIDTMGSASILATIDPGGEAEGNAHLALAQGDLFVTRIKDNYLYRVGRDGSVARYGGTGRAENTDGPVAKAAIARPNGIAANGAGTMLYLNTIEGEWRNFREPANLLLRRVVLAQARDRLVEVARGQGEEQVERLYQRYRASRRITDRSLYIEANSAAHTLIRAGSVEVGLKLLQLNTDMAPELDLAWVDLGEGYRLSGMPQEAAQAYRKALDLNPQNERARAVLDRLQR